MAAMTSLTNSFLIAMPSLADPNFHHSVAYICEHNEHGAMGLVLNHPLDLDLGEVLNHLGMAADDPIVAGQQVYFGGPVQQERGFVLHRPPGDWNSMLTVTAEIAVSTSRDILQSIADGHGPKDAFIALGYAGWAAGQLEEEIAANAWLSGPASHDIIFSVPSEQRWRAAAALLGVNFDHLSDDVGHA